MEVEKNNNNINTNNAGGNKFVPKIIEQEKSNRSFFKYNHN